MANIVVPWTITGILFIVLVILFLNPDKVQIWSSIVSIRLAALNSFFSRRAISGKIQGTVNQFAKRFNGESSGIMPYSLKIEWVKDVDRDALILEEGIVLVKLGHHHNELQKALAVAMLTFCGKSLIPHGRPYLSDRLLRGIDLITTKKMLYDSKEKGSLDHFLGEIVKPEIERDEGLNEVCKKIELMDARGYFSRILLREYQELGRKMYPQTPDSSTVVENEEFLDYLNNIANLAPGEEVELDFKKNRIRVAVMFIARVKIMAQVGFKAYLSRMEKLKRSGVDTVYIYGLEDNINFVKRIVEMAEKNGLGEIVNISTCKAKTYRGRSVNSICVAFSVN